MKALAIHLLAVGAAATAGWFAGQPAAGGSGVSSLGQTAPATSFRQPASGTRTAEWKSALPAVRRVAGAASEEAWIRWALAIPDADVPAAIGRLNPHSDFHALRCLYSRWTRRDPAAAWAAFLKSDIPDQFNSFDLRPEGSHGMGCSTLIQTPRSLIAGRMMTTWIAVDEKAARAFAAKLSDPTSPEAKAAKIERYELERAVGAKAAAPAEAAEAQATAALALQVPSERGPAMEKALTKWMQTDATSACRWIAAQPTDQRRELRFDYFSWAARSAKPAERVQAFTALLEGRDLPAALVLEVADAAGKAYHDFSGDLQGVFQAAESARQWAAADPAAAQAWLSAQPDTDLTALLTGSTAAGMVARDHTAAIALVNAMSGDQSIALRPMMQEWVNTDARAAIAWAGKIQDTALRESSLESAASALAASDPALALETARTLTSDEARTRIHTAVSSAAAWNPAGLKALMGN